MKKFVLSAALLAIAGTATAQNSAVFKMEELLKKNDAAVVIETGKTALANPKTTKKAEVYNKLGEAHARILNPELMKASQSTPFDTTLFCEHLDLAIDAYTNSVIENGKPDAKGKVKVNKLIEIDNKLKLSSMTDYYNYAAMFAYNNKNYDKAVEYFNKYINYPNNPVFTKEERDTLLAKNASAYAQTRFNVALINFNKKDWDGTLKATEAALKDTASLHDLYIMRMQAYLGKNDSTSYLKTLREATERLGDPGFGQDLLREYMTRNDKAGATAIVQDMVSKDPNSKMAWYMKGCVDLDMNKNYPAARESFKKALEMDPNFLNANINMGASYINEVYTRRQAGEYCLDRKKVAKFTADLEKQNAFYKDARPYLEKAKELAPDQAKLWAYPLVIVYENLQMKDKAKEMEAIYKAAIGAK